jgi:CHAT domain-containing protein/tetratricopeptide (TPR) repeat protein|tara:strand:- start:32197 stop:35892 length:3696 start_codon:yes stop_codon:yes gene_type:complete
MYMMNRLLLFVLVGLLSTLSHANEADELRAQIDALIANSGGQGVVDADKQRIAVAHEALSRYFSAEPEWSKAVLAEINQVDDAQVPLVEMLQAMFAEARAAIESGDLEAAISAQQGAVMMASESFGEAHWLSISSKRDLGILFREAGDADGAQENYAAALDSSREMLGDGHPETLKVMSLIAELYNALGLFDDAHFMLDMVSDGFEGSLGAQHPATIDARWGEIDNLQDAGQYELAIEKLSGLCATIELGYGSYHPQSITCLKWSAEVQTTLGQLAEAESSYETMIARLAMTQENIDPFVLNTLTALAEIYRIRGNYRDSQDVLSGVIQTSSQIGAVESSYLARSNLGRVFNTMGQYEKAQQLTEDVLDYGLRAWQDQPINIYNTLLELGGIYQRQGKLAEAEATFEEALTGLVATYGPSHPSSLVASGNLGQIYELAGLYDKAEPLLKETLLVMEEVLGPEQPNTIVTRNNLAALHESQGNFREAEPLYRKSIDMLTGLHGLGHTDTVAVKNNLAYLYMLMEDHEKAAQMFMEVEADWVGLFGEDHQNTLKSGNNLGRVFYRLERYEEAEEKISLTLAARQRVLGESHIDSIRSMIDLGKVFIEQGKLDTAESLLTDALDLAESNLGNLHPYTFEALNALANSKVAANNLQAASDLMQVGFQRRSQFFDTMLWTTGENAREGYIRLHRGEYNNYVALLVKIGDENSAMRLVDASLQRKGLLLKVTSEIQQIATMATDPELSGLASSLEEARKDLAAMTLSGPTAETQGRHTKVLYALEQKVNELQGQIGRASVRFRTSIAQISAERLANSIGNDKALVDYMIYEDGDEKMLLAAIVKKQDDQASFEMLVYEDNAALDLSVGEYRELIQDDGADEDELLEVGMIAYEQVWAPLADVLDGIEYVYLVPDGLLNIAPFNAFVDEDERYLIQTHDIHILTSGRDLLPNEYSLAEGEYMVLAGPDYDSDEVVSKEVIAIAQQRRSSALKMGIRGAGGGLRGLSFAPLPGAEMEGRIIIDQVEASEAVSQNYFGSNAQEQVLVSMETPPEILHIATHGFFLEADDTLRKRILKAQRGSEIHVPPPGDNPLLRAGLAFAGINTNAQFLGDIDTTNDGVLTALEVLDLNLSGTRLVVLSACETGLGEIHEGEGVYGLRRAFQEAGVAEVISSLWEVSDAGTQALMTDFYEEVTAGTPAREALRKVQLDMIDSAEWGYPYVWSAFMIVGSYESSGFTAN